MNWNESNCQLRSLIPKRYEVDLELVEFNISGWMIILEADVVMLQSDTVDYLDVPIDTLAEAIRQHLEDHRADFSPALTAVDLDEFYSLASDPSQIPLPSAMVQPYAGDLENEALEMAEDKHYFRVSIFSAIPDVGGNVVPSLVNLRKLLRIFRSKEFLDYT